MPLSGPKGKERVVQLLWDRPHVLWEKSRTAGETPAVLSTFLQRLGALQVNFGKALTELETEFGAIKIPEGASLTGGWKSLLKQTGELGSQFVTVGNVVAESAKDDQLSQLRHVLDEPVKKFQKNIADCTSTLVENGKQLAKLDAEFRRKKKTLEQAQAHEKLEAAKQASDHALGMTVLESLQRFQEIDHQRVNGLRACIQKIISAHNTTYQNLYKASLDGLRKIRAVNYFDDLEALIKDKASGFACPWASPHHDKHHDKHPKHEAKAQPPVPEPSTMRSKGIKISDSTLILNHKTNSDGTKSLGAKALATEAKTLTVNETLTQAAKFGTMRSRPRGASKGRPAEPRDSKTATEADIEAMMEKALVSIEADYKIVDLEHAALEAQEHAYETAVKCHEAAMLLLTLQTDGSDLEVQEAKRIVDECEQKAKQAKIVSDERVADVAEAKKAVQAELANARKLALLELQTKAVAQEPKPEPKSIEKTPAQKEEEYYAKHATKKTAPPPPPLQIPQPIQPPQIPETLDHTTKGDAELSVAALQEAEDESMRVPIVIDNGSAYFKAGFGGDAAPSLVVSSTAAAYPKTEYTAHGGPIAHLVGSSALHAGPQLSVPPSYVTVNDLLFSDNPNWDDVELAWEYLFSKLSDEPSEHPIMMTIPCLAPLKLKATMEEILFEKFGAQELFIAEAPLLTPYAYHRSTGLVVEVGHSSAQVVPVVDGYVLGPHVQRVKHFGGFADTNRIVEYFTANTTPDELERSKYSTVGHLHLMAQSIKDRLCACLPSFHAYEDEYAVMEDVQGFLGGREPGDESALLAPKQPHCVTLHRALLTCGEMLFSPAQLLHDEDASIVSIQKLCAKVVSACDLDTRNALLENVCLSGQVTTMPGFLNRLEDELRGAIRHAPKIKVHGEARRYGAWTGGAVLSCLEDFQSEWKTRYDER